MRSDAYPPATNRKSTTQRWRKKGNPMLKGDFPKFLQIHQPDEMLYDLDTLRKSYRVLVDTATWRSQDNKHGRV